MIKTTKKLHDNKKLRNKFLDSFFSKTLRSFGAELNLLASEMYVYPKGMLGYQGKVSANDIFQLIERTYVGIFNNAVIRVFPGLATLQEFPVYHNQVSKGRADLLIVKNTPQGSINLLFEAKSGKLANRNYTVVETSDYYKSMFNQAVKYYNAEKKYYSGETYLIAIGFDVILDKHLLKELLDEEYRDSVTDYYYIYHTKEAGLAVSVSIDGPRCV